jgi:hypothetical protein
MGRDANFLQFPEPPVHSLEMQLSCNGVSLTSSEEAFGRLRSASEFLGDPAALRGRMVEDGYLFLPGLLDREAVRTVRLSILERLKEEGILDPAYPQEEGVLLPDAKITLRTDFARRNPKLQEVLYSGAMMQFFRDFLGGDILHFDYTWFRVMSRGKGTRPHCDIVYMGRGTRNLYTAWTPFGDHSIDIGGLMILENSHKQQDRLRNYLERDVDTYCENRPGTTEGDPKGHFDGALAHDADTLRQHLGGRWLTSDFRMGDVLVFSMATVHAGLDNQTNRVRLSSDSRYQLASEPADERWIGENPIAHGPNAKRGMIC